MMILTDPGLLEKIWNDPFEYAIGAVIVIFCAGWVIRTFKEEILGKEED